MSLAGHNSSEYESDELSSIIAAIDELVAEVGIRAVVRAALKSEAGEEFGKLGGNVTLRVSQVIIRQIAFSQNPQLEAEVMALGAGIILEDGATMTRIAMKHGITKQALSKRVRIFCEKNGLPRSIFMKSEKASQTHALTNRPRIA